MIYDVSYAIRLEVFSVAALHLFVISNQKIYFAMIFTSSPTITLFTPSVITKSPVSSPDFTTVSLGNCCAI